MNKFLKTTLIFTFFISITTSNYHMGMPVATPEAPTAPTTSTPQGVSSNKKITPPPISNQQPNLGNTKITNQIPKTTPLIMGLQKEESKEKENNKTKIVAEKKYPQKKEKEIFLNFENAELTSLVNYISEVKKINLIPDKNLVGKKISLSIRNPLTVDGAWNIFLTILDMGGFTIVERGNVYVVVPNNSKGQPFRSFINTPFLTLPDSDEDIRYVVFLQNINVDSIQGLLQSMLSKTSSVIPYKEVNGMVITDKSYNIKSAMKVIQELDQTGLQETVVVMKLKQTNATDVQKLLESLIQPGQQQNPLARLLGRQAESSLTYFSPSTKIIAEERTNSLILMGNQKSIEKIEKFITENLDTELKGSESPLHIYELQHTDAEQMRRILEAVVPQDMQAAKQGGIRGGVKYFKPIKFEVDQDGNRLIASSTEKQDWKMLKKTIKDLDKPQPQVAVETLILTVNFDDLKELGGAIRNKTEGQIGEGVNFQSPTPKGTIYQGQESGSSLNSIALANMALGLTGGIGATIMTIGKSTNIWGIFQALTHQVNTTVLSQPFFTVANNTLASIEIGETLNIAQQKTEGGFQGFKAENANTNLRVKPQINLDGIIRLDIDLDFSSFTDRTLGNKNTKSLKTNVSVANGQVLVLGGFIKSKTEENTNKTPLLGDIPILGWMFKNKSKQITKDYLLIFMSPTIIKPRSNPGANLYTKLKIEDATNTIRDSVQTRKTNDPIHNWFFNPEKEDYSHKVIDFASAKYQPTSVDIKNDPYYRTIPEKKSKHEEKIKQQEEEKIETYIPIEKKLEPENILLSKKREQLKEMLTKEIITKPEEAKIIEPEKRQEFKGTLNIPKNNKKIEALKKRLSTSQDNIPLKMAINSNPTNVLRPKNNKNKILASANNTSLNKLNSRKNKKMARTLKMRNLA